MWIILVCLAAFSATTRAHPLILQSCPCGFTNHFYQNYRPYWGEVSQYRPMYAPMIIPMRSVDPFPYIPRQFTVRFVHDNPTNKTNDLEACFTSCQPDEEIPKKPITVQEIPQKPSTVQEIPQKPSTVQETPEKSSTVPENAVVDQPRPSEAEKDNEQQNENQEIATSSCSLQEAPETQSSQQTEETTALDSEQPKKITPENTDAEDAKEPSSNLEETQLSLKDQPENPKFSEEEIPEETPVTELTPTTQITEPERKAALEEFISSGYIAETQKSDKTKFSDAVPKEAPESDSANERTERSRSNESAENLI